MHYPEILDKVTDQFLLVLQQDADVLQQYALHLFHYFGIIQLTLSGLWIALIGADLRQFITKFVGICFNFGFFYGLIYFGGEWIPDLLNGFIDIGSHTGVQSLNPSSVLEQGLSIAGAIYKSVYLLGAYKRPFVTFIGLVCCLSVIIIYSLIAAELAIVLVKSYVLVALNALFFAFGALDYTRPMTVNYLKSAIGLGLQLLSLYLLIGVGQGVGEQWSHLTTQAAKEHDILPMLVILAAVIVYYMIVKNIPPFVAGLSGTGGFGNHGDDAVATTLSTSVKVANQFKSLGQMTRDSYSSSKPAVSSLMKAAKFGLKGNSAKHDFFSQFAKNDSQHGD